MCIYIYILKKNLKYRKTSAAGQCQKMQGNGKVQISWLSTMQHKDQTVSAVAAYAAVVYAAIHFIISHILWYK